MSVIIRGLILISPDKYSADSTIVQLFHRTETEFELGLWIFLRKCISQYSYLQTNELNYLSISSVLKAKVDHRMKEDKISINSWLSNSIPYTIVKNNMHKIIESLQNFQKPQAWLIYKNKSRDYFHYISLFHLKIYLKFALADKNNVVYLLNCSTYCASALFINV